MSEAEYSDPADESLDGAEVDYSIVHGAPGRKRQHGGTQDEWKQQKTGTELRLEKKAKAEKKEKDRMEAAQDVENIRAYDQGNPAPFCEDMIDKIKSRSTGWQVPANSCSPVGRCWRAWRTTKCMDRLDFCSDCVTLVALRGNVEDVKDLPFCLKPYVVFRTWVQTYRKKLTTHSTTWKEPTERLDVSNSGSQASAFGNAASGTAAV